MRKNTKTRQTFKVKQETKLTIDEGVKNKPNPEKKRRKPRKRRHAIPDPKRDRFRK